MTHATPKWACPALSAAMPAIREAGETAAVDFKEAFPEQAHRLGKEIAGMASSGGGNIYLGVDDDGQLIGLTASSADERDDLAERAHNITRNVNPIPHVEIKFAVEDAHTILIVEVPEQQEPVFYYEGRPYIRDGRRSRIAEPEEVKSLVWQHPSSEDKRRMQDLKFQQAKNLADSDRRFMEESSSRAAAQDEILYGNRRRTN